MNEFTEQEIDLISLEIERQGLTYTLLKNEILDHICCEIETEMEDGLTFNEAYQKVRNQIGKKRIRQIQDETLSLINKKYRIMKKTMYVLGTAAPIMIIVATIFKLQHWPGAGILISAALLLTGLFFLPMFVIVRIRDTRQQNEHVHMGLYITGMIASMLTIIGTLFKIQHMPGAGILISLGLFTLAAVFLPLFAIVKINEANADKKMINKGFIISGVIAGILFIAGALFKVMHWPGAGIVIYVSWLAVAVLLLPMLVLSVLKQKENRVNNFFLIVLVMSFFSVLIMSWVRRPISSDAIDGYIITEQRMLDQANYLASQSDKLFAESGSDQKDEVLNKMQSFGQEADRIYEYIQSYKADMIIRINEENKQALREDKQIDFHKVIGKDAPLFLQEEAFKLKLMLESFKNLALNSTENEALVSLIDIQLDLADPMDVSGMSWEEYYFMKPLIVTATNLSMYQATIRMIEFELLREFQ